MEEVEEDNADIIVQIEEKPKEKDFTETGLSHRIINMVSFFSFNGLKFKIKEKEDSLVRIRKQEKSILKDKKKLYLARVVEILKTKFTLRRVSNMYFM